MLKNKRNFPNKNMRSALNEKVNKIPKIPTVDVIDGRFKV